MPEFKKKVFLNNRTEIDDLTKKTIVFGIATFSLFILLFIFGLPLLIKFSVFLGEGRKNAEVKKQIVLPPQPPRLLLPFESTPSSQITLKGFAEPNVLIDLYLDGQKISSKNSDTAGEFFFSNVPIKIGSNVFTALASLNNDLKSELSPEELVIRDETPPELTISNPDKDSLSVDYSDFDIIGKTDKKAYVTINNYVATVNDLGEFKMKMQLQLGKNEYTIKSRDEAGNQTSKRITITYEQ